MKRESAWALFFQTGLPQAWLLTRSPQSREEPVWEESKTAFLSLTAPKKQ